MDPSKIISFINYKGGVGKTTTTYHVGCSLAQHHGKRVLLVDIDPQCNLTFLCTTIGQWKDVRKRKGTIVSLYGRLLAGESDLHTRDVIWRKPILQPDGARLPNLHLLPGDIALLRDDLTGRQRLKSRPAARAGLPRIRLALAHLPGLPALVPSLETIQQIEESRAFLEDRLFLLQALGEVDSDYDYILIDCPPNLYWLTQSALVASQWYVMVAVPDHLSTIGLQLLKGEVAHLGEIVRTARIQESDGWIAVPRAPELAGVIFVKVRIGGSVILNTHLDRIERVKQMLGEQACFEAHTTDMIGYVEAAENCIPVWMHDSPNARRVAEKREYEQIAEELVRRL